MCVCVCACVYMCVQVNDDVTDLLLSFSFARTWVLSLFVRIEGRPHLERASIDISVSISIRVSISY